MRPFPVCAGCGEKCNVYDVEKCIECQAREGKKRFWTSEEDDILTEMYGTHKIRSIQRQLFVELKSARGRESISIRAHRHLKLDFRTNHDALSVVEAAEECSITVAQLRRLIEQKKIKVIRTGRIHLVPLTELAAIRKFYPEVPEDLMNTAEIGALLGYDRVYIHRMFQRGAFKGAVRRGTKWLAPRLEVERMAGVFKASRRPQMKWVEKPKKRMAWPRLYVAKGRKRKRKGPQVISWALEELR